MMKDEVGDESDDWFEAVWRVLLPNRWTKQTNEQTLVIEESLLQLKIICQMLQWKYVSE